LLEIEPRAVEGEAFAALVRAPDFKSGGGRGDTSPAGSIPVRFRRGARHARRSRSSVLTDSTDSTDGASTEGVCVSQDKTVVVRFKDVQNEPSLREHLEERCQRIADEFPETRHLELALELDATDVKAHGHVTGRGTDLAAHASAPDARQAGDRALEKLERELRRLHDKKIFAHRREAQKATGKRTG
jgi:ribosomal subunit interface protein